MSGRVLRPEHDPLPSCTWRLLCRQKGVWPQDSSRERRRPRPGQSRERASLEGTGPAEAESGWQETRRRTSASAKLHLQVKFVLQWHAVPRVTSEASRRRRKSEYADGNIYCANL